MNGDEKSGISPVSVNTTLISLLGEEVEGTWIYSERLHRYIFVKKYCSGKRVLDLASGMGYGCDLLATDAEEVIGIELDAGMIANSRGRYRRENLSFIRGSILGIPLSDKKPFDVIIGFELLEHVTSPDTLLDEVRRILKKDGLFVVAVPNRKVKTDRTGYQAPPHLPDIEIDKFITALRSRFSRVEVLGQRNIAGSLIRPVGQDRCDRNVESSVRIEGDKFSFEDVLGAGPDYYIILASDSLLPGPAEQSGNTLFAVFSPPFRGFRDGSPHTDRLVQCINLLTCDIINLNRYSVMLNVQVEQLKSTLPCIMMKQLDLRFPAGSSGRRIITYFSGKIRKIDILGIKTQIPALSEKKAAGRWKKATNKPCRRERAGEFKIRLILDGRGKDQASVDRSIRSIMAQTYTDWQLCIIGDQETAPSRVQDFRVQSIPSVTGHFADVLSPAPAFTHIGFIAAGDELFPQALGEVVSYLEHHPGTDLLYTDELRIGKDGRSRAEIYRPDYSEDYLLSSGYISYFIVAGSDVVDRETVLSGDAACMPEIFLCANNVGHIPEILYISRREPETECDSRKKAVERYIAKKGIDAGVIGTGRAGILRIQRKIRGEPRVSIIIPTRDNCAMLKRCIDSIDARSTYGNFEIIIVDNQSQDPETLVYLKALQEKGPEYLVVRYPYEFNYSMVNNFAVKYASGDHLLFLNNDVEVITPGWIEAMLEHSQRDEVACVGARLLYPDGTIQHAGVVIGLFGGADHIGKYVSGDDPGYLNALLSVRDYSAVTSACMMVKKRVFLDLGGFDASFVVGFGDTDLCLRAAKRGFRNIYTPYAELYHHESATRGKSLNKDPHPGDTLIFLHKWKKYIDKGDPFYNPHLPHESYRGMPGTK